MFEFLLDDETEVAVTTSVTAVLPDAPEPVDDAPTGDATMPVAFVFPSKTMGVPHVVSVTGTSLQCTCAAMRSIGHRPRGCWAMVASRSMLGWAPVD